MALRNVLDTLDAAAEQPWDLPHSKPFLQKLPALADVFDAEKMKDLLQETLFDRGAAYIITGCEPGKAMYLADHTCSVQFDIKILDTTTSEVIHTLVNGRLFNDLADCRAYLRRTLIPLTFSTSGRQDLKIFAQPAAVIEPLKLAVSVFPLDGMLPRLTSATYSRRMVNIFNRTLPEARSGTFIIRDVHLELAHYGRYQRCVLRYGIDGEQAGTDTHAEAAKRLVVYGKVDADQQGGQTVQVIDALRRKLREPDLPYYFRVPASYGYLPDINLLLMEALPGEPVIQRLINTMDIRPSAFGQGRDFTIEEAMEVSARILLTLHSSRTTVRGIKLGRRVSLETKATSIKEEIRTVQEVFPELGDQLCDWMDEILEYAQNFTPMPLVLSHGDYTYTQLIFEGSQGGLVDFDTICQAEPALDLGQFLAYQRLTILKDHPFLGKTVDHLCDLFLDAYIAGARDWVHDEQLLRSRVAVYELISLIRLMLHSWQKFKGSRLKLALSLFEERAQQELWTHG